MHGLGGSRRIGSREALLQALVKLRFELFRCQLARHRLGFFAVHARAPFTLKWARALPTSIRPARLRRRRLLADGLGAGRRVGCREGIVDFLVKHSLFGLRRRILGAADGAVRIATAVLHLGLRRLVHGFLLPGWVGSQHMIVEKVPPAALSD